MKKIIFLSLLVLFAGCFDKKGNTEITVLEKEESLPDELKGLKIYNVTIDDNGNTIKIATLPEDGYVNSLTYRVGKHSETVIILDNKETIYAKEIISANDSILVIKIK